MLTRVKSAVANFMGGVMTTGGPHSGDHGGSHLPLKFPYTRPGFLGLSPDEVECSADHAARPILTVRETERLPWATGYAEVINAGKSALNEDQASCELVGVRRRPLSFCPPATPPATPSGPSKTPGGTPSGTPSGTPGGTPGGTPSGTPGGTPSTMRRNTLPNGHSLLQMEPAAEEREGLLYHYWALFDGHAGSGVAVMAAHLLHHHLAGQLQPVVDVLRGPRAAPIVLGEEANAPPLEPGSQRSLCRATSLRGAAGAPGGQGGAPCCTPPPRYFMEKKIQHESLVVGALENAFKEMDAQVEREKQVFNISGGCTALVAVYLLGKLYIANAGDSRAIIIRNGDIIYMSSEFTPESERRRLQFLGFMQPHLLGRDFTHLEFPRRVQRKEVGKKMLYRDFTMTGWAYKTVEEEDLRFPLVYGEGKKARVLATIGVTRGLGDHDLKVHDSNIYIKPFMSCCPEVKVYNLAQYQHGTDDVLVMGTDGLWDVLSNQEVAEATTSFLANCDPDDSHRYTMAAQDLVMRARGALRDRGWRITNERLGSGDDISVFIVPLMYGNHRL